MARIRILTGISGTDFSWRPGEFVDLDEKEAAKWADGVRAVRADDPPPPPPPPADDGLRAGGDAGSTQRPVDLFDPGTHSNREVLAYLGAVGETEALRVLESEAAGQNRAGISKARETVLEQARIHDATQAAKPTPEVAATDSRGGGRAVGIETR
ncbi:hypothetical protein ACFVWX_28985 [Streptomyces sp. NPDC058220]|uniref:hypothetical protein n=1 Tax=Streptomyces sp. NPDC058220 TaxID=3346387 RepID=UPI0036F0B896